MSATRLMGAAVSIVKKRNVWIVHTPGLFPIAGTREMGVRRGMVETQHPSTPDSRLQPAQGCNFSRFPPPETPPFNDKRVPSVYYVTTLFGGHPVSPPPGLSSSVFVFVIILPVIRADSPVHSKDKYCFSSAFIQLYF
eukprot:Hpha_TRINITY_DN16600_c0_g8::TRINITY_DN16600_c0_g8_i1::g.180939::m.180939